MATLTYTVTYTRAAQPATGTFLYTATIASAAYATGWGNEALSATGASKKEAKDNLLKLVQLAVGTNGISDQITVQL